MTEESRRQTSRRANLPAAVAALVAVTVTAAALAGCSMAQPFPDRATYALDPGHPEKMKAPAAALTLRVMPLHIAKPYDSQLFNYKIGPSHFTQDYYAGFIATPDHLLKSQLIDWLNDSGAVQYAAPSGTTLDCAANLECQVTQLYADHTTNQAVIELRVFVISDDPVAMRVLFQKTYHETQPLSSASPEVLVTAWNAAYRRILQALAPDLAGVKLPAAPAAP